MTRSAVLLCLVPQKPPLTEGQIAGLRKDLSDMLANRKCADFVNGILKQLGNPYTDALKLFNKVAEKGGFYALPSGPPWGLGGGSIENGSVSVEIVLNKPNETALVFHNAVARTLFHELLHVDAGSGSALHPEMAQAAYAVSVALGDKNVGKPPTPGVKDYDYQSSVYFELSQTGGQACDLCDSRFGASLRKDKLRIAKIASLTLAPQSPVGSRSAG